MSDWNHEKEYKQPSQVAFNPGKPPPVQEKQQEPQVRLSVPYPQPVFICPNLHCAQTLEKAYVGEAGEFSAVTLYFYQSVLFQPHNPQAARILHEISIVEMSHLKMLASSILAVGGRPVLGLSHGKERIWWSGGQLPYNGSLRVALILDIRAEQQAIRLYNHILSMPECEEVHPLICRIIMDEEHHIELLNDLLKDCCKM